MTKEIKVKNSQITFQDDDQDRGMVLKGLQIDFLFPTSDERILEILALKESIMEKLKASCVIPREHLGNEAQDARTVDDLFSWRRVHRKESPSE